MQQVYYPYWLWEDYQAGMWRNVFGDERMKLLEKAIKFTGDAKLYGSYMLRVVKSWFYSCSVNFTNPSINHQAWVGHAACCLAISCPEDITRLAWHELSEQQQIDANIQADKAISLWFKKYSEGKQICLKLD